jgi:transposase
VKKRVSEKIWIVAKPILQKGTMKTGRPEFDRRKTFFGILFVLENGIKWQNLPSEYGKVSTVHGKFMKWVRNGNIQSIFESIRGTYLEKTDAFKNWYAIDTSYAKAPYAREGGRSPVDRGKRGIKKNLIVDSKGAPLAVDVAPANIHDSQTFQNIIASVRPIKKQKWPIVAADSAYDSTSLRTIAKQSGFVLHAATNRRRNKNATVVRPKGRWRVEHVHSWLNHFRSIKTCYAKCKESFLGLLQIAASIQLFKMIGVFG